MVCSPELVKGILVFMCNRYIGRFYKTPLERFKTKYIINKESECWEWQAFLNEWGYGTIAVNKRAVLAHRFSYQEFIGDIPNTMQICHKCDNRKCVSPFHLFLGTAKENINDAQGKGRFPKSKCPSVFQYIKGCRCDGCKKASSDYSKSFRQK